MSPLTVRRRAWYRGAQRYRLYQGEKKIWPVPVSRYANAVLADNPFCYLRFNDADQLTKKDSSPNGQDCIGVVGQVAPLIAGALPYDKDGAAGATPAQNQVLGESPYNAALHSNDATVTGISFELWMLQTGAPPATHIPAQRGTSVTTRQWALYTATPGYVGIRLFITVAGANTAVTTATYSQLGDSKWHYVVITYDQTNGGIVYLDGAQVGVPSAWKGPLVLDNNTQGIRFQNTTTVGMDEFAAYNYTLTPAQIAAHWAAAWNPS